MKKIQLKTKRKFIKLWFIEFGCIGDLIGICLFDKYCYTNFKGFEILK